MSGRGGLRNPRLAETRVHTPDGATGGVQKRQTKKNTPTNLSGFSRIGGLTRRQAAAAGNRSNNKSYAEKMGDKTADFNERRPENQRMYTASVPALIALDRERIQAESAMMEREVAAAYALIRAAHADCAVVEQDKRRITCIYPTFRFILEVPQVTTSCGTAWTVHPYSLGFAPTSPTEQCQTWIHTDVIHQFERLHFPHGTSASGEPPGVALDLDRRRDLQVRRHHRVDHRQRKNCRVDRCNEDD